MSDEEQDNLESENQEQEAGDSEEEQTSSEQSAESSEEKVDKELYENQKTRAEKAEAKLKELKQNLSDESEESETSSQSQSQAPSQLEQTLSADEQQFIARRANLDKQTLNEEFEKAKKIAQLEGVSISEAEDSDVFQAWKQSRDKQKEQEQAQVGGSQSSSRQTNQKSVADPNLSKDEHKQLWKQAMGK